MCIRDRVDISFRCAIRSLAGLDSIIQTAGRCNRNKRDAIGMVYIIKMNAEAEKLTRLEGIRFAQEAMQSVLALFECNPEKLDCQLDSAKAIKMYFEYYFKRYLLNYGNPMSYPVTVHGNPSSLVNLLSNNCDFVSTRRRQWLKQAFKTAGEEFEAIADTGKISVVVPYDKEIVETKLSDLENPHISLKIKKKILRELQPYTVSISRTEKDKIGQGIYGVWGGRVLALDSRFYNRQTGITDQPAPMPYLQL